MGLRQTAERFPGLHTLQWSLKTQEGRMVGREVLVDADYNMASCSSLFALSEEIGHYDISSRE
jgi:hypothetical protein